jgi:hypothetical protein
MKDTMPEITNEMLAAGIEAKREAAAECLPEAALVEEIFLAMLGRSQWGEETVH